MNDLIIVPKASIRPNKIVFYTQICRYSKKFEHYEKPGFSPEQKPVSKALENDFKQPICNKHNFELSDKAKTRIKHKVNWLYSLSKNSTVEVAGGKKLYAFRMNFITLTLPSLQKHSSDVITNVCLNQFLIECKKRFNMQNYIWRLEFQANGNVHYHIATDCFLQYFQARSIWNRCLEKLGYVSEYAKKFDKMTFSQYKHLYNNNGKNSDLVLKNRFTLGQATRWENPNTVDVKAVNNGSKIAFYISKYITKSIKIEIPKCVFERENMESNLRLWFCSRSLSRLDKIDCFLEEIDQFRDKLFTAVRNVKKILYDYVTVWYYDLKEQTFHAKASLWHIFNKYAVQQGYIAWRL